MDRLIALVTLRWKTELRAMATARHRLLGLLIMVPSGILLSAALSLGCFWILRGLDASVPHALPAIVSGLATAVGFFWLLSPLLAGVAIAESHDVSRLVHFPVRLGVLVGSSLLANLLEPAVLVQAPVVLALALALGGQAWTFPLALGGVLSSFAFILAAAQASGLVLQGLARNRRLYDLALAVGVALGLLLALAPFLVLSAGIESAGAVGRWFLEKDVLALSPFGWGVRAALAAGRQEFGPFLIYGGAQSAAVAAAFALSAFLTGRIHRGALALGRVRRGRSSTGLHVPGRLGALIEKDLRQAWREPALKVTLFMGLLAPLALLFFLFSTARTPHVAGPMVLILASFIGVSGVGFNGFGLERRGIVLLLSFPLPRWHVLLAKNFTAWVLRLPGLATLVLAAGFLAPLDYLPAVLTVLVVTQLVAFGLDNYLSILFPIPLPPPGQNPYARRGGVRGLGSALLGALFLLAALSVSAPLAFLAWLPSLMGLPWLGLGSLPLALAGAAAVYALLVGGAERLLLRREPELLERMLGEA